MLPDCFNWPPRAGLRSEVCKCRGLREVGSPLRWETLRGRFHAAPGNGVMLPLGLYVAFDRLYVHACVMFRSTAVVGEGKGDWLGKPRNLGSIDLEGCIV